MNLIALQMTSGSSLVDNLAQAEELLKQALPHAGDLVLLPENFAQYGGGDQAYISIAEPLANGPIQQWLAEQAKRYAIYLVAGSVPTQADDNARCYTSSLAFSPDGELLQHYHKLHLFDVEVADNVGSYRESDSFVAGQQLAWFDIDEIRVGMAICFDLRFPYLFQLLRQQGCDIVLVPAAFTALTGEAHWQPLLQARAIENQLYLIAANQTGTHDNQRQTWGHSMIVDPWGRCLDLQTSGIAPARAEFNPQLLKQVRDRMPVPLHGQLHLGWRE
ncbi:carbon-nitrogen hydrolase family protein [Agarivorans sp. 1_MG-2023]|uniref:carbon-nitrogen hydrolase family protein n=1 Tax=Agarivorans sp. 1_MG-2023 TaxID=3062634 RepID=UPI0026E19F92|nr:carbon-nitrogen hydrolase family protein [Agarivorans sp. 1_MG-2023]MDO6764602.1 carbon-nitrogen hydrolase family protein [Agarivorans sp. 1_MG-2023]